MAESGLCWVLLLNKNHDCSFEFSSVTALLGDAFRVLRARISSTLERSSQQSLLLQGFAEAFLEHLWKKLQDPNNPVIIRQAAANYIGSFLARAKFIPLITVKSCLDLLVNWLHLYLNSQDSGTKAFCDVALHGPFYSACQAVFYTVVFRHKQLLSGNLKEGLRYLQSLNFERIVLSQLNPLKICLPRVVNFFAAVTNKYQLVFCYTIMERNNRQMLPVI